MPEHKVTPTAPSYRKARVPGGLVVLINLKSRIITICVAMAVTAVGVPQLASANAVPHTAAVSNAFSAATPHCVQQLTPVTWTSTLSRDQIGTSTQRKQIAEMSAAAEAAKPALQCFATPQAAIASATGDRGVLALSTPDLVSYLGKIAKAPAGTSPASLATSASKTASANSAQTTAAATSYIIGIDYQDWHFSGTSLTWTGTYTCTSSRGYANSNIGGTWNDRISSAVNYGYSNCRNWDHYPDANFGGNIYYGGWRNCGFGYGNTTECYEMGSMNDQTTSLRWSY